MERVAVIGYGGRESALVDKYLASPFVSQIIALPGNDWMKKRYKDKVCTFPIETTDVSSIVEICKEKKVAFVDVAQENVGEEGPEDIGIITEKIALQRRREGADSKIMILRRLESFATREQQEGIHAEISHEGLAAMASNKALYETRGPGQYKITVAEARHKTNE